MVARWAFDRGRTPASRRTVGDRAGRRRFRRRIRTLASFPNERSVSPTWTADGRAVVFAKSDSASRLRDLLRSNLETGALSRLRDTGPSAHSPAIGADGTLVYVGYTSDGDDLFTMPAGFRRMESSEADEEARALSHAPIRQPSNRVRTRRGRRSPLASGRRRSNPMPTSWSSVPRLPATMRSDDTRMASRAAGRRLARVLTGRSHTPTIAGGRRCLPTCPTTPIRSATARLTPPKRTPASSFRSGASGGRSRCSARFTSSTDQLTCSTCGPNGEVEATRAALRGGWLVDAARSYGYSIGKERGWNLALGYRVHAGGVRL